MGAPVGRVFKSKVGKATGKSSSVRTSVPSEVATVIGAEIGSTLLWSVEAGSTTATVEVEQSKKSSKRR